MTGSVFYVEKTSGSSADALLATGFALLVGDLYKKQYGTAEGILISDQGPCYTVILPKSLAVDRLEPLRGTMLQPLVSSAQHQAQAGKGRRLIDGFNIPAALENSRRYREQRKQLGLQMPEAQWKAAPALEALGVLVPPPDPRLSHYLAISKMRAEKTFNEVALRWSELTDDQQLFHIRLLLDLFGVHHNALEQTIERWRHNAKEKHLGTALVNAVQITNPTMGKGANYSKASVLRIDGKEQFWLLELLKFRGFMEIAAPMIVQRSQDRKRGQDRKTYVMLPKVIDLELFKGMMREFRAVLWSTSIVKLDILASLRFAQVFVEQWKRALRGNTPHALWLQKQTITSLALGFEVTWYASMGRAYATMNIGRLGLPSWLPPLESIEAAEAATALLEEHVRVIQNIRNHENQEGAEEYELLRCYRDFLSGNELTPFWKFTTAYSRYYMSAQEKKRPAFLLSAQGLETIMKHHSHKHVVLADIVKRESIQHIADAIWQSTIDAQYRRSQKSNRTYEIQYDLAEELKRHAHRPEEFMEALGYFLQQYIRESAREEAKVAIHLGRALESDDYKAHKLRYNPITRGDIADIAALTDEHGPGLICSLLITLGSLRPRRKGSEGTPDETPDERAMLPASPIDQGLKHQDHEEVSL